MSQPHINNKVVRNAPEPSVALPPEPPAFTPDYAGEIAQLRKEVEEMRGMAKKAIAAQELFEELISERNKPHCGQQWREMVDGLARRAKQKGCFEPKE